MDSKPKGKARNKKQEQEPSQSGQLNRSVQSHQIPPQPQGRAQKTQEPIPGTSRDRQIPEVPQVTQGLQKLTTGEAPIATDMDSRSKGKARKKKKGQQDQSFQSGQSHQIPPQPPIPQGRAQRAKKPRPSRDKQIPEVLQVTQGLQKLTTGDQPVLVDPKSIQDPQEPFPMKPIKGFSGTKVELKANYFPISTYTDWSLNQYRVDFSPEENRNNVKRGLLSFHQNVLGGYLFDGTVLFTDRRYNEQNFELTSKRHYDDQIIIISIKFVKAMTIGDISYIHVFNILIRKCLRHLNLKLISRNYYDQKAKVDLPQHKLQLWPGYETSIGMFEGGILLCAEISTKVLRQDTVLDFLKQCANSRTLDWMNNFKMGVLGTVVMTMYNNETYRINDIDLKESPRSMFTKRDGTKISYLQYYKEKYNITIRNMEQPMLISKRKKISSEETLVYLVPELCCMTGLSTSLRTNFSLMRDLATFTRVNPKDRITRLNSFVNRLLSSPESVAEFKRWNLTLSNSLINVPGRVLSPIKIYGKDVDYTGGNVADWTSSLRKHSMYICAPMKQWIIVTPQNFLNDVLAFNETLKMAANGMSFVLPTPIIHKIDNQQPKSYLVGLEQVVNERNPTMILCVIPSNRDDIYNLIKQMLCINRAVPSQVVLHKNVKKNNLSVCTKIAIQINCKIGGAPWKVAIPIKGMMIIGFDVFHDTQNLNKSYGALIATMDDSFTSYFSCVERHEKGVELANHFNISFSKALIKYKAKNTVLPSSIVIYRDGVGVGQMAEVKKKEIECIKNVCKKYYDSLSSVKLVFIIVTKRISTRFFYSAKGVVENPPPGTVIDDVVTDPVKYDFYLISQHVNQGTVTPTHYQVIEDSLQMTPDRMQKLTYHLTHLYYNWSGTVRVPAPCQLAHRLAYLTGKSLKTSPNTGLEDYLYFL